MAQKEYELNIDPRILELLGPNLYTNIYYVLAELIANAYDANAKNVYIIGDKDCITVEDDGNGMSYEDGDINKYLNVAHETRQNTEQSFVQGSNQKRKKMGRKGVGKLAALSVSENVKIKTIKNNDKSGFILSRNINDDRKLTAIDEDQIDFINVKSHGTSIVMEAPQYDIHKTLPAARKNILRMFPLVDDDFKIHLQVGKTHQTIDCFEKDIIKDLGCLYTIGEEFKDLHNDLNPGLKDLTQDQISSLSKIDSSIDIKLEIPNKSGEVREYLLSIKGWIGAYRSTRGRKTNQTDFPDNFISLIANKKLGEFNILPEVGKNALIESFIVGQIHVDLFEDSTLPDMALSNRQGYKTDDIRYTTVRKKIKDQILPAVINLRNKWASYKKQHEDKAKNEKNKNLEDKLKKGIDNFKKKASSDFSKSMMKSLENREKLDQESIEKEAEKVINMALPEMGIKSKIDKNKKELLISHNGDDKPVSDFVFNLLVFTGVPAEAIIYTSNDDAETRIPESKPIYDYLRDFFVNSYSDQKIYVIYITSNNMAKSWPCVSEVGAGWITKSEHNILNINNFLPSEPLNTRKEWASLNFNYDDDEIHMNERGVDVLAEKLIYICKYLDRQPRLKDEIKAEIKKNINLS